MRHRRQLSQICSRLIILGSGGKLQDTRQVLHKEAAAGGGRATLALEYRRQLQSGTLKRRPISAPACGEACWILHAARARHGSSPRAPFPVRHGAPNKYGRRATRSLPWSDVLRLPVAFSWLSRNFSHSWTYSPLRLLLLSYN